MNPVYTRRRPLRGAAVSFAKLAKICLVVLVACSFVLTVLSPLSAPQRAFAAQAEKLPYKVHFKRSGTYGFGQYSRGEDMWINGVHAYCADSPRKLPDDNQNYDAWTMPYYYPRKILYYGFHGPGYPVGYDRGLWRGVESKGMDKTFATHIMLTYAYKKDDNDKEGSWKYALSRISSQYSYYQPTLQKLYDEIIALPDPPAWFKDSCIMINPNNATQTVMSFRQPTGVIKVHKRSANKDISDNATYSLEGAQFAVYSDPEAAQLVTEFPHPTDHTGWAMTYALDPGTYYVKETKPALGYQLDPNIYEVEVTAGGVTWVGNDAAGEGWFDQIPLDNPIGILLNKHDAEKELIAQNSPQAAASLADAQFEVKYYDGYYSADELSKQIPVRTWIVRTNENGSINLRYASDTFTTHDGVKLSYKVSGDPFFTNKEGLITLPLGTVSIQEIRAPQGYVLGDEPLHVQQIKAEHEGKLVSEFTRMQVPEQVIRGDLELVKVDEETKARMAGVAFEIISDTTGERHVIVTDKDGHASTAASVIKHTHNTNGNDETQGEPAGVWFGEAAPNDALGALIYDTYTINELPGAPNEGKDLIEGIKVTISHPNVTVDLGTLNNKTIHVDTSLIDGVTKQKIVPIDTAVNLVDQVHYTNLKAGRNYTVVGTLMDKATNQPLVINGSKVTTTKAFTAQDVSGSVDVNFEFDASSLGAGIQTVAFEEIYEGDRRAAVHADINDAEQTVEYVAPHLETMATDTDDGDKLVTRTSVARVTDRVFYSNLTAGHEYRLEGVLMDKAAAKPLVVDSKQVTASAAFMPDQPAGSVDLTFEFDSRGLSAGTELVAFQKLYRGDVVMTAHEDLAAEGQTVTIVSPDLTTIATDGVDGDKVVSIDPQVRIVDAVSYQNLKPGREYTMTGVLMDKTTGEPVLVNGEQVTSSATFTPEQSSGSVEVVFEFDGSGLTRGSQLVAFETLFEDGVELAAHADIDDEDQTVLVAEPSLKSRALDAADQDKNVLNIKDAKIIDTIEYCDVIAGREYRLEGLLMNKATGEPLLVNNEQLKASAVFEPEESSGAVELSYELDGRAVSPQTAIVAFNRLYRDEALVSRDEDINNEDQTVTVLAPKIVTTAVNNETGDKAIYPQKHVTVVDTVKYEGLIAGKTYELKAVLMDKATSKPCLVDNKPVAAERSFVPESSAGAEAMYLSFDGSGLKRGNKFVVFEELYLDGELIAAHRDLDDEGQTVYVPTLPQLPKTADSVVLLGAVALGGAGVLALAVGYAMRRRPRPWRAGFIR